MKKTMSAVIAAMMMATSAMAGVIVEGNGEALQDATTSQLIRENRLAIYIHAEKLDGATKIVRTVIIPDESLKNCDGQNCKFPWGAETLSSTADGHMVSSLDLDLRAVKCSTQKTGEIVNGQCIQRIERLSESEFAAEMAIQSVILAK